MALGIQVPQALYHTNTNSSWSPILFSVRMETRSPQPSRERFLPCAPSEARAQDGAQEGVSGSRIIAPAFRGGINQTWLLPPPYISRVTRTPAAGRLRSANGKQRPVQPANRPAGRAGGQPEAWCCAVRAGSGSCPLGPQINASRPQSAPRDPPRTPRNYPLPPQSAPRATPAPNNCPPSNPV